MKEYQLQQELKDIQDSQAKSISTQTLTQVHHTLDKMLQASPVMQERHTKLAPKVAAKGKGNNISLTHMMADLLAVHGGCKTCRYASG